MNILLTGAGMKNKGAQSLTFIIASEVRRRFPQDNIILLLPEKDDTTDYSQYHFDQFPAHIKSMFYLSGGFKKLLAMLKDVDHNDVARLRKLFSETRMLIDISGYALASTWGTYVTRFYLSAIECAQKFRVPVYLMPQSFGPFEYKFPKSVLMNYQIRKIMKYPVVVYAREQGGAAALQKFGLSNVRLSPDLVLLTKEVEAERVFVTPLPLSVPEIPQNSVAVLPNVRLLDKRGKDVLLRLYRLIINTLLQAKKTVYIVHHSSEDLAWADEIAEMFPDNSNVCRLRQELSCLEYEQTVKQFDFIVASRYHSIVHALKQGIPSVAIGWADKYGELMATVKQSQYVLDARKDISDEIAADVLRRMLLNFENEAGVISSQVQTIQNENNILDFLDKR